MDFLWLPYRVFSGAPRTLDIEMGKGMVTHQTRRDAYTLEPRVIAGTREEKLEQIDDEIQYLLKIKSLECGEANAQYLAARERSHWFAMTVTILVLLLMLVLLLTASTARAQSEPASAPAAVARTTSARIRRRRSSARCGCSATS